MNIAQLERDARTKADAAVSLMKSTMATAETEKRLMSEDERAAINAKGDEAKAARAALDQARGDLSLFSALENLAKPVGSGQPQAGVAAARARLSLGQQFVMSEAGEFHRNRGHRSGSSWRSPVAELYRPSMMAATLSGDPASGGALVLPTYVPGIMALPTRRLVVADLFAQGTTDSNMVSYMREKTFTNAAAAVAQGAAKPESEMVFEAKTSKVEKIAHWLPVTEEMLEDVPQLMSYIDARLTLGVELAEEDELLNGGGATPHLLGINATPGLTPSMAKGGTENNADVLARQALTIYGASFLMPDGFVLNPANWAATLLLKDGSMQYYVGNPFGASLLSSSLWGLPVAVTPAEPVGEGLVGAFKTGAQIFRHGGIRVESSNSHADFFIKNLVAIRAEERLALATYRPAAFGKVTALDPVVIP